MGDAGDRFSAFRDRKDGAVRDTDPHVARPAGREQSVIEKEFTSQVAFSARRSTTYI